MVEASGQRHAPVQAAALACWLPSLPPAAPGPPGRALTLPQAEANLAYLLENRIARLAVAAELLSEFAIDLRDGLDAPDPKPWLQRLGDWTAVEWPSVRVENLTSLETWLNSRREGREIVFSLIMDIAIVLAEMVLRRRDDYRWALDVDPKNGADGMLSWRRPVVLRPADDVAPTIQFDFEDVAYTAYVQCGGPGYNVLHDFGRGVLDAISGAQEAFWREKAARRG